MMYHHNQMMYHQSQMMYHHGQMSQANSPTRSTSGSPGAEGRGQMPGAGRRTPSPTRSGMIAPLEQRTLVGTPSDLDSRPLSMAGPSRSAMTRTFSPTAGGSLGLQSKVTPPWRSLPPGPLGQ